MEYKDQSYDPDLNCHSDGSDPELNNIRDACSSVGSPLDNKDIFDWNGFTLNSFDRGRAGGPQSDKDPTAKNSRAQKTGTCGCCKAPNQPLFHATRHKSCQKGHEPFCESCASGYDDDEDPIPCPHSENPPPKIEADKIPLEPVYD